MDNGKEKAKLIDAVVRERFAQTRTERQEARKEILKRQPPQAEPDTSRAQRYARSKQLGPEALQGDSINHLSSWFLRADSMRSRAVACPEAPTVSALCDARRRTRRRGHADASRERLSDLLSQRGTK